MTDATARFALPFIASGQAQKELFHNEALALMDVLLQPSVQAVSTDDPPAMPVAGQCWIVGAAPTGPWEGQAQALAGWTADGWRFIMPQAGTTAWSISDSVFVRFDGVAWQSGEIVGDRLVLGGTQVVGAQQSAVAAPAGGTTVDSEARDAISAMLAVLRNHGLIAS